jgi:hypothetical protein
LLPIAQSWIVASTGRHAESLIEILQLLRGFYDARRIQTERQEREGRDSIALQLELLPSAPGWDLVTCSPQEFVPKFMSSQSWSSEAVSIFSVVGKLQE